ncbi:MAG: rRNA maturation RNase YbeY [Luteibaculaceae bacterium]
MAISFQNSGILFQVQHKQAIKNWIKQIATLHQKKVGDIALVFCSAEVLLDMNQEYLNHDTHTDIITFNYNVKNVISGDIFISVPMTQENAKKFHVEHKDELHRVIAHGILHLCGFNDKTPTEKSTMQKQEDICLNLRQF